jgi:hypothetical protein
MKSTMSKWLSLIAFAIVVPLAALAQMQYPPQRDQTIRAQISGGGGSGKCTFEVNIDGAADVEIRGSEGRLRWVGGGGMSWRRLQCNQPLPRNPRNFRFSGVDGRGSQTLVQNPNNNNGVAVIRLDDPQKGAENYTGDIFWDGDSGSNGNNNGDWNNGGNNGNWNGGNWNSGGNWSRNAVSNCQNAVRNQMGSRPSGSLVFSNSVNADRAGSVGVVQGLASNQGRGRASYFQYSCVVRPSGDVTDTKVSPIADR